MKLIKSLSVAFLIGSASLVIAASTPGKLSGIYIETPAKTVCIKAAGASDANTFFSTTSVVAFEIYKPGTPNEMVALVSKLKGIGGVDNVIVGKATGDYQMFNVSLKAVKDKTYWINLFKAAGCGHIKLNTNPIVEIDKM